MQAITIPRPGDETALILAEVDDPKPGPGEVLIDVAAAGVNRADLLQRQGFYDPPPGASRYPGLEVSGYVSALGAGVQSGADQAGEAERAGARQGGTAGTPLMVGSPVCALLTGGGYAEKVAVPAGQVLPVPDGVSLVDAAALPEVACTVWSNVFMTANLLPGQTLLVHGGSSGIGTMAIQLAKAIGARVAVTAGTPAKLEACRGLGADILINYREQDFVEALRQATDGHGADVILDPIGAKYLERNLAALATSGRLVVIGFQGGTKAQINLSTLLGKRAAVIATSLRARPLAEKSAIVAAVREHVWPLVERGTVRPVVHTRVPLAEAAQAHRILAESSHVGKVLLVTEPAR